VGYSVPVLGMGRLIKDTKSAQRAERANTVDGSPGLRPGLREKRNGNGRRRSVGQLGVELEINLTLGVEQQACFVLCLSGDRHPQDKPRAQFAFPAG
jgi:hypothetical protein